LSPWLAGTVKPWLEEKAGLVPRWALFFADRPWLIPATAVSITLVVVVVHAYASAVQTADVEMADLKRRIEELIAENRELTMQQVQARTEAAPEAVEHAVEGLRATGRIRLRSTAKGQVIQVVGQASETDQAMPITPVEGTPSGRGRVARREIVYDEKGREAGEEVIRETRDARINPETVEAKADVPTPTVIAGTPLKVTPTFPTAEIVQGPRPGWQASCEVAPPEGTFGRGVLLSLKGPQRESASAVICRVFDRAGGYFESGRSAFGIGDQGNSFTKHYPGEFEAPSLSKGSAPYRAVWLGNVGDPLVSDDITLDEVTFDIDDVGRPKCG